MLDKQLWKVSVEKDGKKVAYTGGVTEWETEGTFKEVIFKIKNYLDSTKDK